MRTIRSVIRNAKHIFLVLLTIVFISFIIVESLIVSATRSEEKNKFALDEVCLIIVLGAGLRGEDLSLTLFYRLNKGLEYLRAYPQSQVVVTGGQGPGEDITEAEAMKRYLVTHGIQEERIIMEEKSTSTLENLLFSKRLLQKEPGTKISLVTSDFHLFRAKMLARRVGFVPTGIPAESVSYLKPYYYTREYFAVVKSFFLDQVASDDS